MSLKLETLYHVVMQAPSPNSPELVRVIDPDWINGFSHWRIFPHIYEKPFGPHTLMVERRELGGKKHEDTD